MFPLHVMFIAAEAAAGVPAVPRDEAAVWVAGSLIVFVIVMWTALQLGLIVMGRHHDAATAQIAKQEDQIRQLNKQLQEGAETLAKAVDVLDRMAEKPAGRRRAQA